jgi:small-conductance mechanosensitive channel
MPVFAFALLGVNAENGKRLLVSVGIVAAVIAARYAVVAIVRLVTGEEPNERAVFWTRQGASLGTAVLVCLALGAVWFENTDRLTTVIGFVGAGLAFALQKVVTAFAGYLVILRGKTFTVGDRITMGGVRGDVVALTFLQTRIMEMGEPPAAQSGDNPSWINARQYTGRIVTVTNDKVFEDPVYNYTREFPFMWEELRIPIGYKADRRRAEAILTAAAHDVTASIRQAAGQARGKLEARYFIDLESLDPKIYYYLTDNWIELHLRFLTPVRGVRAIKDEIQRRVVDEFEAARIDIASGTYDIVGLPPVRLEGGAIDRIAAALEQQRSD